MIRRFPRTDPRDESMIEHSRHARAREACWAVIPAAGGGTRMGADRPKQYLPLAGKTVIRHVLERFNRHP